MNATAPNKRLFLALWPDPEVRGQLAQVSGLIKAGRPVNLANIHMTLVFLGATEAERQNCYERALAQIIAPGFELYLNRLGYWRRSGIVWLAPQTPPAELISLVEQLKSALLSCGFRPEKRPFKAHITLARKYPATAWPIARLSSAPSAIHIRWRINRFALLESLFVKGGVHYRELRTWSCANT